MPAVVSRGSRRRRAVSEINDVTRIMFTEWIKGQIGDDPDLLSKVIPDYPATGKRTLQDNGSWLHTLTQDHVELVRTPIARIERDAVVTADGARHPADVIVYATGFHAPGFNDLYFPTNGRSTIRPEQSRAAELGLYWNPPQTAGWHGKAVAFESRVRDLISYSAVCPDPDPRYSFGCADNVDRARIKGLSLGIGQTRSSAAGQPASGLSWYLNVDFLDPRNQTTATRLPRRATRQLSAGAEYGVGAVTFGIDLLAANRRFDDTANLNELGGYAVFNLRAAYRLTPEWQTFATVDNAGDRAYATARDYAQQGRLVMLGVRYQSR